MSRSARGARSGASAIYGATRSDPEAGTYAARFCWSRGGASDGGVPTPICEDVDFEYRTDTSVSLDIDGN